MSANRWSIDLLAVVPRSVDNLVSAVIAALMWALVETPVDRSVATLASAAFRAVTSAVTVAFVLDAANAFVSPAASVLMSAAVRVQGPSCLVEIAGEVLNLALEVSNVTVYGCGRGFTQVSGEGFDVAGQRGEARGGRSRRRPDQLLPWRRPDSRLWFGAGRWPSPLHLSPQPS